MNHVDDETGEQIPCDCDIMLNALESGLEVRLTSSTWCGDMSGQLCFESSSPLYLYRQIVMASSPVMWLFLDRVATLLLTNDVSTGL